VPNPTLALLFFALTLEVADVSQHSHDIGLANLAFTRRGRRAQAAAKSALAGPSTPIPQPSRSQSQSGGPSPLPNLIPGQVVAPMRPLGQPELTPTFSSPYPHFPSMSMPPPQGLGSVIPLPAAASVSAPTSALVPTPAPAPAPAPPLPFPVPSPGQAVVSGDRERMERERWDRMDVLYQSIRSNVRQFEYPAASVAALESVLVRMYFESPIPAPHPQPQPLHPAYATGTLPLTQVALQQQPESVTMGHGGHSDGTSESDGDEEDEE